MSAGGLLRAPIVDALALKSLSPSELDEGTYRREPHGRLRRGRCGLGRDRVDLHWSIPDPAQGGAQNFRKAFNNLSPRIGRLAGALTHGQEK